MKYLVCFDGSSESQNAVEYVKVNANKETDEIVLFGMYQQAHDTHIQNFLPSEIYVPPAAEWVEAERKRRHTVAKYRLDCAKRELETAGFKQLSEHCVEAEDVRDAVIKAIETEHANAVVVGSRGFNMIKATFVGSLSNHLVANSPVPVIVARNAQTNRKYV